MGLIGEAANAANALLRPPQRRKRLADGKSCRKLPYFMGKKTWFPDLWTSPLKVGHVQHTQRNGGDYPKPRVLLVTSCYIYHYHMVIPISSRCVLSFGLGATREGGAKLGDPGSAATWEPMMASGDKGKMMVNRSTSGWTKRVPYFRPKKQKHPGMT